MRVHRFLCLRAAIPTGAELAVIFVVSYNISMQKNKQPGRPRKNPEGTSASQRVQQSIAQLKAAGGDRKTFRLRAPAVDALTEMVESKQFPTETAAVEGALCLARSSTMSQPSLYPLHVDSAPVQAAVDAAVRAACEELDALFPGARPEVNGVSSNFAGMLESHIKALLTGKAGYVPSHWVQLPVLLATDSVFGKPFALPDEPGCGYMVVDDTASRVLSAYSNRFLPALGEPKADGRVTTQPGNEVDVLFSTHEGAVGKALDALKQEGVAPNEREIRVLIGVWDDQHEQYVEYRAPTQ